MYHPLFHKIINAALILSCIFLLSCENDESKVKNLYSTKTGVEEARTITLNYTIGGKTANRNPLVAIGKLRE